MVLDRVTLRPVLRTVLRLRAVIREVPIGLIRVVLRVGLNVVAERIGARWVTLLGDVRIVRGAIVRLGADRVIDRGVDLCTDRVGARDIGARDIVRVAAGRETDRETDRAGAERTDRAGAERTDRAPPVDRTRWASAASARSRASAAQAVVKSRIDVT